MKTVFQERLVKGFLFTIILSITILPVNTVQAQSCPPSVTTTITSYTNTYYPGQQAMVSAGSTSIALAAATYGTTPVTAGDVLLLIQMQGAQINSSNNNTYGDGVSGSGYLNNAQLYAGNMEYVIAINSIPLAGGSLTLQSGTINNYKNADFGTDGGYTYQVIRVPLYYDLLLNNDITPPRWDGATGGVIVLAVMNTLNMNGHSINVTGAGFRGGGGVQLYYGIAGATTRDFAAVSPTNENIKNLTGNHASKGEGIAGTPRLVNNNNYDSLRRNIAEGYPGGSFGMSAPGNAGGGGSDDGTPNNSNNSGGGGGGNGGAGGKGGNSYSTNGPYGGYSGAPYAQRSIYRLVMGGGGGAGDTNDGTGTPASGLASSGAAGGGIVIIAANAIINPGSVFANGNNANTTIINDGSGGGGAGGSVSINARSGHSNITVFANGGNGGTNNWNVALPHGPGGGGGGGVIFSDGVLNAASSVSGGIAGTTMNATGSINYGALPGNAGIIVTGPVMIFPVICTVLPVQFLELHAKRNGTQVLINWEVTNEKEITNYIIERSYNGNDFITAGIVGNKPANGFLSKYDFSDASAGNKATTCYRIIAQHAGGQKVVSKIISIQTVFEEEVLNISPVPATSYSTITWTSARDIKLDITVFDEAGHAVLSRQYPLKKGVNELLLTNLETLPAGVYFVKAFDGAHHRNGKLIINHTL